MVPYADDNARLSRGPLQHASDSIPGRKLAQLVSKFETMDLVGSRGGSSKQKSSLRRAPLLLPGSKTMSSLFRKNPQAASSVSSGLNSLPSSTPKQKISASGSVQHLPTVTLYPPEPRKGGDRPRAKSTVAETRMMFEPGSAAKLKKEMPRTPTKVIKNPLRSTESSETVLFSRKQPLIPSLSSTLNYMAPSPSRVSLTPSGRDIRPKAVVDGMYSTVDQTKPSKLLPYHHAPEPPRYLTRGEAGSSILTKTEDTSCHSVHDVPSSTRVYRTHHGDRMSYSQTKTGYPRVMAALEETTQSFSLSQVSGSNQSQPEASATKASHAASLKSQDGPETVTLFSRAPAYPTLSDSDARASSSKTSSIAGCSTPDEQILFQKDSLDRGRNNPDIQHDETPFQKMDIKPGFSRTPTASHETLFRNSGNQKQEPQHDMPLVSTAKKWTPQRIVTPQKVTVANDDKVAENRQGQGGFVRGQAPPTLRETIGLFESMSYRGSLSAACQSTAREPKKPAQGEIKVPKRSSRGTAHGRLKGSLRSLSSTWGRKAAKRGKTDGLFSDYPDIWKVNSIRSKEGKNFHTQICELSQPQHESKGVSLQRKPLYESYSSTRKVWDSWARDKKDGRACYGENSDYQYTSLHPAAFPEHGKSISVEETSSVYSTDVSPAMEEAIEAARRRSRRWISRSSGTLVSQAHCRLEQPKPVHANEVKRLISLCKTRVVGHKRRGNTE